jgi:hypothetical protein
MSGSIIPTPFATPDHPCRTGRGAAVFMTVSVVMMPVATWRASVPSGRAGSAARPARTRSIGYWRPITPVDAIEHVVVASPSRAATPAATSSALARPSSPVATLAFFEMTTTACARWSATCRRLTSTLGPAKLLRVNRPAALHGWSATTTTKSLVSSLMPMLATWLRKPRGRGSGASVTGGQSAARGGGRAPSRTRSRGRRPRPG